MTTPAKITIPVDTLRDFLARIFEAAGCDAENARMNAQGVVEADLHGHHIQGTDHIYSTVRELRAGRLNGRAKPKIVSETTATARVDGDGGTGHVTGVFATDIALRKAHKAGIGAVGLVGGGDIFMLGYYVEKIARAGLVGMTFTNTFPIRVHPAGGIDPLLGTNPLAFGFPVADKDPVIVDLSTSTSAIGHVRIASYSNAPIPPGIAIDRQLRQHLCQQRVDALPVRGGHAEHVLDAVAGELAQRGLHVDAIGLVDDQERRLGDLAQPRKDVVVDGGRAFAAIDDEQDQVGFFGRRTRLLGGSAGQPFVHSGNTTRIDQHEGPRLVEAADTVVAVASDAGLVVH